LVNCASVEYFSAVDANALEMQIITPVFLEDKAGGPKIVSFFAKKARGAMARYIVENRLTDPDQLQAFDTGGYAFEPSLSEPDKPAFLRRAAAEKPPDRPIPVGRRRKRRLGQCPGLDISKAAFCSALASV
jgi:cytoplasmic iron level regulating protein YaaA (DUF328/UPF0246 family)